MKEIRMVDLKGQYLKIKPEVDAAIAEVIDKTEFISGSHVKLFQKNLENYLQVKHVIPCGNGTDALQIALMALGLKPGDEVITSDFTFIATLEVIALLGLTPVIVDVDPKTFNISIDGLRKAITSRTKAIIPVHLFGQCAEMEEIMDLAHKNGLKVVEDAAQACGTKFNFHQREVHAGTIGDIGCTSFFPSKNLGCYGDGGALFTNDDQLAELIRSIANHGMKVRYYHDHVGINSRLDSLQAAILNCKLPHLDEYNKARQEVANRYDKAFSSCTALQIPERNSKSAHIFHQYTLVVKDGRRDELKNYLQLKGIPAMVYYPVPLHEQNAYQYLGYKSGDFPVTEYLCKNVISLPIHTEMEDEQMQCIINSILAFF